jgi:hypothetical protein
MKVLFKPFFVEATVAYRKTSAPWKTRDSGDSQAFAMWKNSHSFSVIASKYVVVKSTNNIVCHVLFVKWPFVLL